MAIKKSTAEKTATKKSATKSATKQNATKQNATKQNATKKGATKKGVTRQGVMKKAAAAEPVLLAGGNPQIPKGEGDAPVQAYIAAMPGWKQGVGRQLDRLVVGAFPEVHKAVKWNSPFYGVAGDGWFLSFHCFTKYVKVAFFRGTSLDPVPPGESKSKEVRYVDIHEHDVIDEKQFTRWVRQAVKLPGERM